MTAVLLFCIMAFNAVIMVPLYCTGDPIESDNYKLNDKLSKFSAATVLNITDTHYKMVFSFIAAIVIIPAFAFIMIYMFRKKYYSWKKRLNPM